MKTIAPNCKAEITVQVVLSVMVRKESVQKCKHSSGITHKYNMQVESKANQFSMMLNISETITPCVASTDRQEWCYHKCFNQQSTVDKYYEGPYIHTNMSSLNKKNCYCLIEGRLTFENCKHRMDVVWLRETVKGPTHPQFTTTGVLTYFTQSHLF